MEKVSTNSVLEVEENEMTYHCPKCGIGHLNFTGLVLKGEKDKYMHKCDNLVCGYKELLTEKYI